MFFEDFEVQYCDAYQKEIVCKGNCSSCPLQKMVDLIWSDDGFYDDQEEEETEDVE